MKRIIIHWTAGGHKASDLDRSHYHFVIEGDGNIVDGVHPPEANAGPLVPGHYAAHTLNGNTGSIGVALAAMIGAQDRPFKAGRAPITGQQIEALASLCASLCRTYRIEVARETVLSHAEVQPTLGIKQRGKWDISWIPGMAGPRDPVEVGDILRAKVSEALNPPARHATAPKMTQPASRGLFAALAEALAALFRRKT